MCHCVIFLKYLQTHERLPKVINRLFRENDTNYSFEINGDTDFTFENGHSKVNSKNNINNANKTAFLPGSARRFPDRGSLSSSQCNPSNQNTKKFSFTNNWVNTHIEWWISATYDLWSIQSPELGCFERLLDHTPLKLAKRRRIFQHMGRSHFCRFLPLAPQYPLFA